MRKYLLIALVISNVAFAGDLHFKCSTGLKETTMVLNDHHIVMDDIVYTNMMEVDESMVWRGYTKIGNPWRDITIVTRLLHGETGTAIVNITDLDSYEHHVDSYQCELQ